MDYGRILTRIGALVVVTSVAVTIADAPRAWADRRPDRVQREDRLKDPTVVAFWNEVALEEIRKAVPRVVGPPMAARALAVVHTCMYDAWAAYDDTAVPTVLRDGFRRHQRERSKKEKSVAISVAAHRCLLDLFATVKVFPNANPQASVALVVARLDAALTEALARYAESLNDGKLERAAAVGDAAAAAVLADRANDGANQHANMPNTKVPGLAYSDWGLLYVAVNTPMDFCQPTIQNCPLFVPVTDRDVWQPLIGPPADYVLGDPFLPLNPDGTVKKGSTQAFVGCHFENVRGFALRSSNEFDHLRPGGPEVQQSEALYRRNVDEILEYSARVGNDDALKLVVEYWADGPASELPPGHWGLFAQYVSQRDKHTLDEDVKMFFAMHNASFDAGIVAWHFKRRYDGVRPITAVRNLMAGKMVEAWGGPGQPTMLIPGETWSPYNPGSNLTPAFPGYISGHSTFSSASAEVLKHFTGSDHFAFSTVVPAGFGRAEDPRTHPIPAVPTVVSYATFSDAADAAALSRILGGIHFMEDNTTGLELGRLIGRQAWEQAVRYFNGTAHR